VGKTTLALQFLLAGATAGESCLYITLSETKEELLNVSASHGWSLDKITIFELSNMEKQLNAENQSTVFHPSEMELNSTTQMLLSQVEQLKPRRVVFDSLSEMRLLAQTPLRYRREMLSLKTYFANRDCTVLLLDDLTAESGDAQVQSIAHGVIMLQKIRSVYGAPRRQIEIVKLRGVKFHDGCHDYVIQKGGIEVFPRLIAAQHRTEFKKQTLSSGVPIEQEQNVIRGIAEDAQRPVMRDLLIRRQTAIENHGGTARQ
jgi:circadian clock protein KaiC